MNRLYARSLPIVGEIKNFLRHVCGIGQHNRVRKAEHEKTPTFDPTLTLAVAQRDIGRIVRATVQFNNKTGPETEEIDDEWANRRLSAEMRTFRA